jgi:hypothetical protein
VINQEDYEYIEMTKGFPLTADDFKTGNRKNEDVIKIKQHQRIEKAIIANFPDMPLIEACLTKQDIKLVEEYKNCGFSIGEISLLCREVSLQTAIQGYIFDNECTLDEVSANILDLYYKEKDMFDTPGDVREATRLDASGLFPNPPHLSKLRPYCEGKDRTLDEYHLNANYISEIKYEGKYEIVDGIVVKEHKTIINSNGKKEKKEVEKIIGGKKVFRKDTPFYQAEEYNLYESDAWKNVFSKFENFKNIEDKVIEALQEYRFIPDTVKYMGVFEFKDLIGRYFGKENEAGTYMFIGSVNKRVMDAFKGDETSEKYTKYLKLRGKSEKEISLRLHLAKTKGLLLGDLSTHHIVHVSNAGKHLDYNHINADDNLLVVSKFIHTLIHSNDREYTGANNDKVFGLFPEKEVYDMMLSLTPLFRIKYSGKKQENTKELPTVAISKIKGKGSGGI